MSFIKTDDNVKLFYESTGKGEPIIFVHEFAGDYRSWEPQINYLSRYYQCISFCARGTHHPKFQKTKAVIAKKEHGVIF